MSNISSLLSSLFMMNNAVQGESDVPRPNRILSLRNTLYHWTKECPCGSSPYMVNKLWNCSFFYAYVALPPLSCPCSNKRQGRQRTTEITEVTEAVPSYRLQTPLPIKKNLSPCSWFWCQVFNRVNLTEAHRKSWIQYWHQTGEQDVLNPISAAPKRRSPT